MKVYWHFFKLRFLSEFIYRANLVAFLLTQALWLAAYIFLWTNIYAAGGQVGDYDFRTIMTYSVFTLLFQFWTFLRLGRELAVAVGSGDLNSYLVKPLNFLGGFVALGLGRIGLDMALGIILISGVYIFFPHFLVAPALVVMPAALVALLMGIILIVLMSLIMGQISFYSIALIGRASSLAANIRVFGFCYYFVSMNIALLVGFFKFLTGTQKVTWDRTER